jgi:hypothetical protein
MEGVKMMTNLLRKIIESKKKFYIERLIDAQIYRTSDVQVYEMTLSELEQVYNSYKSLERDS